ncbi:LysR substrate-binding domain-containing protein [Breoghania sp. JC706]|uniref:LysR substrate-binding domain-containing protein n=1 Tax=Breoghania sp. JC706 TaxID=3117732 RepID=UPI003008E09E
MRNVSLKQLRALAAVVRTGTVTAASSELHVTPPAVTSQIRLLEEAAGMPLLERFDNVFHATAAGAELLGATKRIELALAECEASLQLLRGLGRGRVAVGVVSTAKYFAPMAIAGFAGDHPDIEIRLVVGNRGETVAALADTSIDIAVMGRPPSDFPVEADVIGDHPHIIIAPPDHPLVGRGPIDISELSGETFLVREEGSGTRMLTERVLAEMKMEAPRYGMEISSNETIKQAVMAGLGIALLSAHTCATELEAGRLSMLEVVGLPVVRQWHVVKRADHRLLPAAEAFRAFMAERGAEFLPAPDLVRPLGGARRRG